MIGLSSFTRWSTHPSVMFPDTGQNQIGSGTVTLILNWFDELKRLVATDPDWWSIPGFAGYQVMMGATRRLGRGSLEKAAKPCLNSDGVRRRTMAEYSYASKEPYSIDARRWQRLECAWLRTRQLLRVHRRRELGGRDEQERGRQQVDPA